MANILSIYTNEANQHQVDSVKEIIHAIEGGVNLEVLLEQNPTYSIVIAPTITTYGIRAAGWLVQIKTEKSSYVIWCSD